MSPAGPARADQEAFASSPSATEESLTGLDKEQFSGGQRERRRRG